MIQWRPQVMKRAHVARQRLLRLGIFRDVEVLIDTSEGKVKLAKARRGLQMLTAAVRRPEGPAETVDVYQRSLRTHLVLP